jgi:tetratricopeptide (TPR) repeat protein
MTNTAQQTPAALLAKAVSHHKTGDLDRAESIYHTVLSSHPGHSHALTLLGTLYLQRGDRAKGIALIERSLAMNPYQPMAHNSRANALKELERYEEALEDYDRAVTLDPRFADAWSNRGLVLKELGRHQDALTSFDKAIALQPGFALAFNNRANTLKELQRYDEALANYDRALALDKRFGGAWSNRGLVLSKLNRHAEALASCDKAVALQPEEAYVHNNRGEVLAEMNRPREALASCERAIAVNPVHAELHLGPRDILGSYNHSLARYDRTAVFDLAQSYFAIAFIKLRLGEWNEGWELYEWRWRTRGIRSSRRKFECPLWLGKENLAGKTILLHAEQGFGDAMLFGPYVPIVEALGATR